jgi:hypothetical protein
LRVRVFRLALSVSSVAGAGSRMAKLMVFGLARGRGVLCYYQRREQDSAGEEQRWHT